MKRMDDITLQRLQTEFDEVISQINDIVARKDIEAARKVLEQVAELVSNDEHVPLDDVEGYDHILHKLLDNVHGVIEIAEIAPNDPELQALIDEKTKNDNRIAEIDAEIEASILPYAISLSYNNARNVGAFLAILLDVGFFTPVSERKNGGAAEQHGGGAERHLHHHPRHQCQGKRPHGSHQRPAVCRGAEEQCLGLLSERQQGGVHRTSHHAVGCGRGTERL